jgi:hypothetical protein
VGELYSRGTRAPVVGARVEVHRKSGILVEPEVYATQSDADGEFFINLHTSQVGVFVADVRVFPPEPQDSFIAANMVLAPTPFENHNRFLARWGVGDHVFYTGELQWQNTNEPIAGIEVEFRRTGGLAIEPGVLRVRTGADGRFHLHPFTSGSGTVVGDLIVRPGTPQARTIASGLELASFPQDNPRFLRIWWLQR